jgi:hypothetical protein
MILRRSICLRVSLMRYAGRIIPRPVRFALPVGETLLQFGNWFLKNENQFPDCNRVIGEEGWTLMPADLSCLSDAELEKRVASLRKQCKGGRSVRAELRDCLDHLENELARRHQPAAGRRGSDLQPAADDPRPQVTGGENPPTGS